MIPQTKSPDRQTVETLLTDTKRHLTVEEIATLGQLVVDRVRAIIDRLRYATRSGSLTGALDSKQFNGRYGYRIVSRDTAEKDVPVKAGTTFGTYDGAELKPFDGRPGAMDAFSLPSLVSGERVPRTAPRLLCVGKAGPAAVQAAGQPRFSK